MPVIKYELQTARELKKHVSKFTPLIDFRLFGSRARGDADDYSDMGIFMEFDSVDRDLRNMVKNAAWEISIFYIEPFFSHSGLPQDLRRLKGLPIVRKGASR